MVTTAENALHQVKRKLYDDFKIIIKKEHWVDHDRKAVIETTQGCRFFVLFKREHFHSYGRISGEGGDGESINVQDFEYAVYELDIEEFLYIYPDNSIYKIRAVEIRKAAVFYNNEKDGREQYLFSIKKLQRIA
jgi:hypothetical protein